MDFKIIDGGVCAAKGFKASGVYCAIKENPTKKNDIALIVSDVMCNAAGVYTSNKVKGAPVVVTKKNLEKSGGKAKAVIVNSKNANTCNADGEEKAEKMCSLAADALGIKPEEVIVASTGVIGQVLPIEPIVKAVPQLVEKLSYTGNVEAATAIMTTDTVKKEYAFEFDIGGKVCHLGGMAKGSGMIHPNMATTLNFITTDCAVSAPMLQKALSEIVKITYNCLSVDGDQSTNDTCIMLASGAAAADDGAFFSPGPRGKPRSQLKQDRAQNGRYRQDSLPDLRRADRDRAGGADHRGHVALRCGDPCHGHGGYGRLQQLRQQHRRV